jgi:hypothetical protein
MSRVHVWLEDVEKQDSNTYLATVLSCDPDFGAEGETHSIGVLFLDVAEGRYRFERGAAAPTNMLPPEAFLERERVQAMIASRCYASASHSQRIHALALELLGKLTAT